MVTWPRVAGPQPAAAWELWGEGGHARGCRARGDLVTAVTDQPVTMEWLGWGQGAQV